MGLFYNVSALEVFLNDMRYINPRFIYLLNYDDAKQLDEKSLNVPCI